jgi:hypothetical protein
MLSKVIPMQIHRNHEQWKSIVKFDDYISQTNKRCQNFRKLEKVDFDVEWMNRIFNNELT